MSHGDMILVLVNLGICSVIGYICVCRLNGMTCKSDRLIRLQFVALLVGATAHGWEPLLFRDGASLGGLVMSSVVLVSLLLSFDRWQKSHGKRQSFDSHSEYENRSIVSD